MNEKTASEKPALTEQYSVHNPKGAKAAMPPETPLADYYPATAKSLTGQQLQALAKQQAEQLTAIKRDVDLRKWAIDQACSLAGATNEEADGKVTFHDPIELARQIHAFLTEAANTSQTT